VTFQRHGILCTLWRSRKTVKCPFRVHRKALCTINDGKISCAWTHIRCLDNSAPLQTNVSLRVSLRSALIDYMLRVRSLFRGIELDPQTREKQYNNLEFYHYYIFVYYTRRRDL